MMVVGGGGGGYGEGVTKVLRENRAASLLCYCMGLQEVDPSNWHHTSFRGRSGGIDV